MGAEGFKQVRSAKDTTWITGLSPRSWSGRYEIDGAEVSSIKEFDEYIRQGNIILRLSNESRDTLDEVIKAYKKKAEQESSKSGSTR